MFIQSLSTYDSDILLEPPREGLIASLLPDRSEPNAFDPLAIGIVCMTKNPRHLLTWLRYHRDYMLIRRFFLRVEDTPDIEPFLSAPPWSEVVEASYAYNTQADYIAQTSRQAHHVDRSIARARELKLEYLLHIDDDEILYCAGGLAGLHAALRRAPPLAANVHLDNLEALFPSIESTNPFLETCAFRHKPGRFCAYSNGKSLGRLSVTDLRAAGVSEPPFLFRGDGAPSPPQCVRFAAWHMYTCVRVRSCSGGLVHAGRRTSAWLLDLRVPICLACVRSLVCTCINARACSMSRAVVRECMLDSGMQDSSRL